MVLGDTLGIGPPLLHLPFVLLHHMVEAMIDTDPCIPACGDTISG